MQEYTSNATAVMSAQSSCEEMYLFQKILRDIGISNIDHRSKECDFKYQDKYPIIPSLDIKLSEIESMENIILVNVNITKEFPILSVYLRNAVKQNSSNIISLSAYEYLENFDISHSETLSPKELEKYFTTSNNILSNINKDKKNLIIMGPSTTYLKNYTNISNNISRYAKSINSKLSLLGDQCNTSGAWAMGVVPHRLPGGKEIEEFKQTTYLSSYPENDLLIIYNLEPEYVLIDSVEITNEKNTLEKIIIRSSNSNNPTLRRCKSLLTTHDNDNFMSIPKSLNINSESKITINELDNSFKIKTNIKVHHKPDNTILVKMNGRYAQKIGSYNTNVDLS